MPKVKENLSVWRRGWIAELGKDSFTTDGKVVFCQPCSKNIPCDKKFQLQQHIATALHVKCVKSFGSKKYPVQQLLQPATFSNSPSQDQFALDLSEALLAAGIPWNKVNNTTFKTFLEKYSQRSVPDESTLRKKYLDICYQKVLAEIRGDIADGYVWMSVDETTDAAGRAIANFIVGKLDGNGPSQGHLLASQQLDKTNFATVSRFVDDSLQVLFPDGIPRERVLLFVTDAAKYMKKAGVSLKVFYPNLVHVTCVAHGLHRVAEIIRDSFPEVNKLIASTKKVFVKAPNRVQFYKEKCGNLRLPPEPVLTRWGTWLDAVDFYAKHWTEVKGVVMGLSSSDSQCISKSQVAFSSEKVKRDVAFISSHFAFISGSIKKLENQGLSLVDQVGETQTVQEKLSAVPGQIGQRATTKFQQVFRDNEGYGLLERVGKILAGNGDDSDSSAVNVVFNNCNPLILAAFKFAPITSCDVERSFSRYKRILSERSHHMTCENMNKVIVCEYFHSRK